MRKTKAVLIFALANIIQYSWATTEDNNIQENKVDTMTMSRVQHLEEVIVRSSKNKYNLPFISGTLRLGQSVTKLPQNVQVVTNEVLKDQQIISLDDGIQRTVSGVAKLEHWSDYVRINMRGSRAAAFREGMNITSTWGPMVEDMSYVDRVEIVKGPAGFMMSNGEPSGLYNIVTKKPTGQTKGSVGLTLGSYDLYRATLDLDGKLDKSGKLLYRFNAMGMSSNSFRANEFNKRISIAPVLRWKIDDKSMLTFEYDYQYMNGSNIGGYYTFSPKAYASLPRNYSLLEPGLEPTISHDHTAILNFQHELSPNWRMTAQGAFFLYKRTGSSLWPNSLKDNGDIVRGITNADVQNEMKFAQIYFNGQEQTGSISHNILAGLDAGDKHAWYDWSQNIALDEEGTFNVFKNRPTGTPSLGYHSFDRSDPIKVRANNTQILQSFYGLYAQDELGFFDDKLRLTLAGRFTYVHDASYGDEGTKVNHFSPRVGLSYSLDDNTSFYALYDQTFTPQAGIMRNGKKVDPVTGNNWEVGAKRQWLGGRLSTAIDFFRILMDNQSSADPQNTPQENYLVQVGQAVSKGIEFDLAGEILPGLSLLANYAFTDYKITKSVDPSQPKGTRMPGYAKHTINVWAKYLVKSGALKGFNVSLGQNTQIDRSTWAWGDVASNKIRLPDYVRWDGAIGWSGDKMSVMLNVYNLTNKYLYAGSYYGTYYYWQSEAPRNFRLSVTYNF